MTITPILKDRVLKITVSGNGEQREWQDLRVVFKISKTGSAKPNESEIAIYNLNEDSRFFIKRGMTIKIEGGYKETQGLIMKSIVDFFDNEKKNQKVTLTLQNSREATDWRTSIKCFDKIRQSKDIFYSKSFSSSMTDEEILKKVVSDLKLDVNKIKLPKGTLDPKSGKPRKNGVTIKEHAELTFQRYARKNKCYYHITDGVVNIYPYFTTLNNEAILIDESSGLIEQPIYTEKGWDIQSLLRWEIVPGTLIKVESNIFKGFLIVINLTHTGDTRGNEWYTNMECINKP